MPVTDAELAALALAADPDAPLDRDAVALSEVLGDGRSSLLPDWYMPAPWVSRPAARGAAPCDRLVILAFLMITVYGLCNTYGQLQ